MLSPIAQQIFSFIQKEVDPSIVWAAFDTLPAAHDTWDDLINVAVQLRLNKQWDLILLVRKLCLIFLDGVGQDIKPAFATVHSAIQNLFLETHSFKWQWHASNIYRMRYKTNAKTQNSLLQLVFTPHISLICLLNDHFVQSPTQKRLPQPPMTRSLCLKHL